MTVTVKLEPGLESRLRLRATTTDRNTSDVIRAALLAYLDAPAQVAALSAHALGADLFGRHGGSPDLATDRKQVVADIWSQRDKERSAK